MDLFVSELSVAYDSPVRDAQGAAGGGPQRRIIVVDDDREIRVLLAQALSEEGYGVIVADNGLRLISALSVDAQPDLILMDIMMSWINGFELCRSLQQNERYCHIPVAFVSGKTTAADIRRGLACGAVDYFTKPLDLGLLIQRLPMLISAQQHRGAGAVSPRE